MKFLVLIAMTLAFSQTVLASSCSEKLDSLIDLTSNAGLVDGRESELRNQLTQKNINEEKVADINERITSLQTLRLNLQSQAGEAREQFELNCVKNK